MTLDFHIIGENTPEKKVNFFVISAVKTLFIGLRVRVKTDKKRSERLIQSIKRLSIVQPGEFGRDADTLSDQIRAVPGKNLNKRGAWKTPSLGTILL